MPTSAPRPCAENGCHELVDFGRCAQHERKRQQEIDARRESSTKRGYGYRWQNYRRHWLRLHPLCGDRLDGNSGEHSECVREGRVTAASQVDHRKPHRGDKQLFWDQNNHQSLCVNCHSSKTASEDGGFGNRVGRG